MTLLFNTCIHLTVSYLEVGVIKFLIIILGLKFWKVGSRKLFAVKRGKKRSHDDSDLDPQDIPYLQDKLSSIDEKLTKILNVSPSFDLPLGFLSLLHDTFQCCICKGSPIIPPAIFAKCCRSILGCSDCVEKWYEGEQGRLKSCPLCRSDRAYADTTKMSGLDDLLTFIGRVNRVPVAPPLPHESELVDE